MKISDLQHGRMTTLEVVPTTNLSLDKVAPKGSELLLSQIGELCAVCFTGQLQPILVEAVDASQQRELTRLLGRETPRLCWLVNIRPERNKVLALTIQIHEFSESISLPDFKVGIDEKLKKDMERQMSRPFSIEAACTFLANELLISSGPLPRAILMGQTAVQGQRKAVFRLLGVRFALDIRQLENGAWQATRLTRPRTARTIDDYRPVFLAEGDMAFIDQTVAGKMRQGMATELDQIVHEAGSYLGVWAEYQSMEERRLVAEARRFGWLCYNDCHRLSDGRWHFELTSTDQWTSAQLSQTFGDEGGRSLEASSEIPEVLINDSAKAEDMFERQKAGGRKQQARFRGKVAASTPQNVHLRPDFDDDEAPPPPPRGYLYVSIRGDQTRMQRRRDALTRISTGQNAIPRLAWLLENKPFPARQPRAHPPLSAAARAKFHSGLPNPQQVAAIEIALNTPDIAIIQGPPGTGKTRTIAAIIERLTEISKKEDVAFDRVLLTSFQHDAVENVASTTQIFGLPAMKIGQRRDGGSDNLPIQTWTEKTMAELEADSACRPTRPLRKLLADLRIAHASYVQSPGTDAEAARLLSDLGAAVREHLSAAQFDRIASLASALRLGVADLDDEGRAALQAVRGLRVQENAFTDDGPRMAWRVLEKLGRGSWLSLEDRSLLQVAKEWQPPAPLDFLPELEALKSRLLDLLQNRTPHTTTPLVNGEVVAVLYELVNSVEARIQDDVDEGPDMAVEQFINDIKNDPDGLRDAIERYTVVLAATCQQAVSNRMVEVLSDDIVFETVIVDEAARANPLDLLIPMSRAARRIILVGDHRQLPHLLEPEVERELESSVRDETRDLIRKSLFERLFLHVKKLQERDRIKRWVTLDTQYRMHPVLGTFVSDAFYKEHGEGFFSPTYAATTGRFTHGLGGGYQEKVAVWKNLPHVNGQEQRSGYSWLRRCEANWIAAEARRLLDEAPGLSVGVISFYAAQVDAIKEAMLPFQLTARSDGRSLVIADAWQKTVNSEGESCERLRVGTVDAFQGKEFDIVFLSLTRSNKTECNDEKSIRRKFGHLLLENRLCVAMSRQKRLLIAVGDAAMASEGYSKYVPGIHAFFTVCQGQYGAVL